MSLRIFYDKDADLGRLDGKTVAIIGYGSQGHAHALNLRDSGVRVVVGLRKDSTSRPKAENEGLRVLTPGEAAHEAQVVMLTLPDERMADIYKEDIEPHLADGDYLAVAHGFNIHFGQITPPENVNVFMAAPKGPGHTVRGHYEAGKGVPSLVAVHADPAGDTLEIALAYAKGIGAGRAGIIETNFREETETDLFGEQAVLCGGLTALMTAGYETLVDAGYSPEMAYFETIHEVKLIVDLIYEGGIANMRYSISNTAEYGDLTRGPRVVDDGTRARMKEILREIQSGQFAREFILENRAGNPGFKALAREGQEHDLERVGAKLRGLMPWLAEKRLVDRSKN